MLFCAIIIALASVDGYLRSRFEAYRPELRFADAVKGLYLYGAKVVYSNEMASINFTLYHSEYTYD